MRLENTRMVVNCFKCEHKALWLVFLYKALCLKQVQLNTRDPRLW